MILISYSVYWCDICLSLDSWNTVYRVHASLLGADILYIESMQACLELIYGKSEVSEWTQLWLSGANKVCPIARD